MLVDRGLRPARSTSSRSPAPRSARIARCCSSYVSTDPERYDEVLAGLESAKGRIRSLLGHALGWRVTPELRFFIDEVVDAGMRIDEALTAVPPTLAAERAAEARAPRRQRPCRERRDAERRRREA